MAPATRSRSLYHDILACEMLYGLTSQRMEMSFAHLKRILRLRPVRLRGPRGVLDEFELATIAQNLGRLVKPITHPPPLLSAAHAASSPPPRVPSVDSTVPCPAETLDPAGLFLCA